MSYNNILDYIWNTPLIRINKLNPNPENVNLLAKVEWFNPTWSIKDRVAMNMVEKAEKEWKLNKGKTIIEATSGNTGIWLAMIGACKWYSVEIVMSEAVSIERMHMIQAFWAKITLTDWKLWTDWAIKKAREKITKNPEKYFMPDQFSNENNKLTHYHKTWKEIWKQTRWKITHFVSSIWTSGTIMWVGSYLKEQNSNIKIICAHPTKWHYIQWLKNMQEAIVPSIYDPSKIDETIMIETNKAYEITRKIVENEGIFVGMSSWAAMYAAIKIAEQINKECNIVVIFPDRWEKYLTTNLFELKDKSKLTK